MSGPSGDRWAIVGGGLLGLTLAHRLLLRGNRVTLFEAAPSLGGLASAWNLGEFTWDRHYHVILATDSHLLGLLRQLGLEREVQWRKTRTGFFSGGRLHSFSNVLDYARFPELGPVDKVRLARTLLRAARIQDWRALEQIPVEDWLVRESGRRTFDTIWLPLLRAKLGENYRKVSAAFIWATIARLYGARTGGARTERFGHVRGGYGRILEAFSGALTASGATIRTATRVTLVRRQPNGAFRVVCDPGEPELFDRVVVTLPSPAAAPVCADLSQEERARLAGVEYQGIVCASLLLRRPLGGYYVTNITDAGFPFTAVIEMTALVDSTNFGGRSLVYLPRYAAQGDPILEATDEEIQKSFLDGLRRIYPDLADTDVSCFCVSRARNVFPLPTLDYSRRAPAMQTSVPGLFTVNSAQIVNGTLNVNEAVRLADRAMGQLL